MPTEEWFKENPKVSAYIPQSLNERLLEWMKGRNIKKVSQGLTTILEEYLGVVQNEPTIQNLEDSRIEALEQKFEDLSQVVQELRKAIQVGSLPVVQNKPIQETLPLLDAIAVIETKQPIEEEIQDDEPDEILYEFLESTEEKHTEESNDEVTASTELAQSEESSPKVEEGSLITGQQEAQELETDLLEAKLAKFLGLTLEEFNDEYAERKSMEVISNAKLAEFLGLTPREFNNRYARKKIIEAKGFKFMRGGEKGNPHWKIEKLDLKS